jgi:hypothetical protein
MTLPKVTMSIAPGGYIRQKIVPDKNPSDTWDREGAIFLNVNILNSTSCRRITGYNPPPTPVDAAAYAKLNLPYFQDYDDGNSPSPADGGNEIWGSLKSISEIDGFHEPSPASSSVEVDVVNPRTFSPFAELLAQAKAMKLESDLFDPSISWSEGQLTEVEWLRKSRQSGRLTSDGLVDAWEASALAQSLASGTGSQQTASSEAKHSKKRSEGKHCDVM